MIKIKVKNLNFSYSNQIVLQNLNLEIQSDSINVILGLNGSGKTTLIKLLSGLLKAKQGQIFIDGRDIVSLSASELSKLIAYVPQNISNDNDFLVIDYLTFGRMNKIKFYASPKQEDYDIAKTIAQELDISHLLDKKMNELSGGQRQLVVIARAVMQNSEVILMDEPTSSIDYKYLDKIIRYLDKLKQQGKTIVLSCHNPSIPLLLNSNILTIEKGEIVFNGLAREVLTCETLKTIYGCNLMNTIDLPYKDFSICPIEI